MGVMTRLTLVVSAAAAAGVFAGSSVAVSKAIVTCGDTITSPGLHVLAADCSGGITITSDNVTLQMMGHEITDGGSGNGIAVQSVSHVSIKGPGTLLGYGAGVFVSGSSDVRVGGLEVAFSEIGIDVYESTNVAVTHDSTFFTLDGVELEDSSGSTPSSRTTSRRASASVSTSSPAAATTPSSTTPSRTTTTASRSATGRPATASSQPRQGELHLRPVRQQRGLRQQPVAPQRVQLGEPDLHPLAAASRPPS